MIRRMLPIALALLAIGCADTMHSSYSQPYVKFEAEHNLGLQGLFPATVVAVDGQRINAGETPPFPPGAHAVEVEMRLQHDAFNADRKTVQVDAKPCTRYYFATRRVTDSTFEALVSTTEPIKECEKVLAARQSGGM